MVSATLQMMWRAGKERCGAKLNFNGALPAFASAGAAFQL
jgi:hypothetical protein